LIAAVLAGWTWLTANSALVKAAAPWLLCAAIGAWGAIEHFGWEHCSAAAAAKAAQEQQAVLDQKERDRRLGTDLVNQQLTANEKTDQTVVKNVEVIRHVPDTGACPKSPAQRAARDGLLDLGFPDQAGPAAAGAAAGAGAPGARPRRRRRQRAGGGARSHRRVGHQARRPAEAAHLLRGRVHGAGVAAGAGHAVRGSQMTAIKSRRELS
jgi:hypothetical protein